MSSTSSLFKKKKKYPTIRKWSSSTSNENWTMVSFKPRLGRLDMKRLDDGVVFLMKRRVVDLSGCSGLEVQLDGTPLRRTFKDYCDLYPSTDH
ncbi:DNA topoisomerase 2, partial [Tanacetum coccineum]